MKVYIEDNKLCVVSDYSAYFVREAKKLNGKWNGTAWCFNVDDEEMVREALMKVYGEDGRTTVETVKVEVDIENIADYDSIELFGRVLAKRFRRDSEVKMHDSVVVKKGGFGSSGGSIKNPSLNYITGTILIVKNVPISLVEKEMKYYPNDIKIISEPKIDKEALEKEKESLLKRLAEIEDLLK